MMNYDQMIAVLQAAKAGKQIQCRVSSSDTWVDCSFSPAWNFYERDYRVKPEPREFWILPRADSNFVGRIEPFGTPSESGDTRPWIHVREVLD